MTALKHRRHMAQLAFEAELKQPTTQQLKAIPWPCTFEPIQPDLLSPAVKNQHPPEERLIARMQLPAEYKPSIQPQSQPPLPPVPGCNPGMPSVGGLRVRRSMPSRPAPMPPRRSDLIIGSVCFFIGIALTIFSTLMAGGFICSGLMSAFSIPFAVLGMASGMLAIYGMGRLQRYSKAYSARSAHRQFIWQNRLGLSSVQQPPAILSPLTARLPGHP